MPLIAAMSLADLPIQLGQIFYFVVLPMLLLIGLGYAIARWLGLDMRTLVRLNFYIIVPGIVYHALVSSEVEADHAAVMIGFHILQILALVIVTLTLAAIRRVRSDQRAAMLMGVMFYNSGNYGLPLQELAFARTPVGGSFAMALQIFPLLVQNFTGFTIGVLLAATGGAAKTRLAQNVRHMLRFPPLYALAAALITIGVRNLMGPTHAASVADALSPFWKALTYVRGGFVLIALVTLGAQLANVSPGQRGAYPVGLTVGLRLIGGPIIGLGLIGLFQLLLPRGLAPEVAQVLLISTAVPTAVNAMLLCLEFDNHPSFLARTVFFSTLISPLTVTLIVFTAQSGLLGTIEAPRLPQPPLTVDMNPITEAQSMARQTTVSIEGQAFHLNGEPTYPGRTWRGMKIEGLLMNSRMVQGVFDDLNPETVARWDYPDGKWDAQRNTREFIEAMPQWREHGLLGFTINFQGGSPQGYSKDQPWHNSSFEADGALRPDYADRMARIVDRADELGMVVILGYFYFGQDERLADEHAVIAATDNATDWVLAGGWTNVIVEIANEVNVKEYEHPIICPPRCHELIERVIERSTGKVASPAGRLLVGTSMGGGAIPPGNIVAASDFLLLHGNGVSDPARIAAMVDTCRAMDEYRGQPILFNEDDHFNFDAATNNMVAAVSRYAGWGYFDFRMRDEGYDEGYQSVPTNWGINSDRKRGFFDLLAKMTGAK